MANPYSCGCTLCAQLTRTIPLSVEQGLVDCKIVVDLHKIGWHSLAVKVEEWIRRLRGIAI